MPKQYVWSDNEEHWSEHDGPYVTREAAIMAARRSGEFVEGQTIYTARKTMPKWPGCGTMFDAQLMLENFYDHVRDNVYLDCQENWEADIEEVSTEQMNQFEKEVEGMFRGFLEAVGVWPPRSWWLVEDVEEHTR
jgi:hypothetical protein